MRTDILQQALAVIDRSRAKKQAETLKRHELVGHYFVEVS